MIMLQDIPRYIK